MENQLPSHDIDTQITKSERAIAVSKGVGIVAIVGSLLLTGFATVLILISQERAADRMLDCVVPTGACYQKKILHNQQTTDAQVTLTVNYCLSLTPNSLEAARTCIEKGLDTP